MNKLSMSSLSKVRKLQRDRHIDRERRDIQVQMKTLLCCTYRWWINMYLHTINRSHSGPHGTASGCQGKNWSLSQQQAAVETSTWPASPFVDATTGSRHRTRRWCRMGHSQWSSSMEGTTTHRRSSGL